MACQMNSAWVVIMGLMLSLSVIGRADAAQATTVYYWNGDQRVEMELALDQVVVTAEQRALGQELAAGKVAGTLVNSTKVLLTTTSTTTDELKNYVEQLRVRVGVKEVHAALYGQGQARGTDSVQTLTSQLSVRFSAEQNQPALLKKYNLEVVSVVSYSPHTFICALKNPSLLGVIEVANHLFEQEQVVFATPLIERLMRRRGDSTDPLFITQWFLKNTGTLGAGTAGNDLNVTPVWDFSGGGSGLGAGINVAVVDDSLEYTHADLSANARTDIDLDINGGDDDPAPESNADRHGTAVGGIIAANGENGVGGSGVAPRAQLVGIRLISGEITDFKEAQAMVHQLAPANAADRIMVSNNSWGPADDGMTEGLPGPLMLAALQNGATNGRGGKGIVYTWAGGNGLSNGDISNYDGYASSRFVIGVAATAANGQQASYSEAGTNILVNAPGGEFGGQGMVTTDRTGAPGFAAGNADYTALSDNVVGTSFSAPAVAGVVALILEKNPDLTARDVRHALVRTATKNHNSDAGWQTNGAGLAFNLKYGFGRVNAAAAVAAVASGTWQYVPAGTSPVTASEAVTVAIPDNNPTGITRSLALTAPAGFVTEYIELKVSMTHSYRGDVRFRLTAPSGMVSDFQRRAPDSTANYSNMVLTSVAHWGENPNGNWSLKVSDEAAVDTGQLTAWSVTAYGYLNHPAPTISSFNPLVISPGAGDTVVTINGSNYIDGITVVTVNGNPTTAVVNSSSQMMITIPAALLVAHAGLTIGVNNPPLYPPASTPVTAVLQVGAFPLITATPANQVIVEDTTTGALAVTLSDADGDPVTLTATSSNPALISPGGIVLGGSGYNRTITITPVIDANGGPVTIYLTASDGFNAVQSSFTVVITAVNDTPVALGGRFRVLANGVLTSNVYGYDVEGTALSFVTTQTPTFGTFNLAANGAFTFNAPSTTGLYAFSYTVDDGNTVSDPATAFISVAGDPNGIRPLIVSEPSDEVIAVGEGFNYGVIIDYSRYFVPPNPANITYALIGEPAGMTISTNGVVTWTAADPNRHVSFGIMVRDLLTGAIDTQLVVLRIVAGGAIN